MDAFPHRYVVKASGRIAGAVELSTDGAPLLSSASPRQFDGPGDRWSPETLLVGAVADCFILTFRAIARASQLEWTSLDCHVTGTLDRVDRVTQFTGFNLQACLAVPYGVNPEVASRLLEKAERNCLITSSLKGPVHLDTTVDVAELTARSA
jgi:organic hydroperoxide reductase OsmC/OhrA